MFTIMILYIQKIQENIQENIYYNSLRSRFDMASEGSTPPSSRQQHEPPDPRSRPHQRYPKSQCDSKMIQIASNIICWLLWFKLLRFACVLFSCKIHSMHRKKVTEERSFGPSWSISKQRIRPPNPFRARATPGFRGAQLRLRIHRILRHQLGELGPKTLMFMQAQLYSAVRTGQNA